MLKLRHVSRMLLVTAALFSSEFLFADTYNSRDNESLIKRVKQEEFKVCSEREDSVDKINKDISKARMDILVYFAMEPLDEDGISAASAAYNDAMRRAAHEWMAYVPILRANIGAEDLDHYYDLARTKEINYLASLLPHPRCGLGGEPKGFSKEHVDKLNELKDRNKDLRALNDAEFWASIKKESFYEVMKTGHEEAFNARLFATVTWAAKEMDIRISEYREMREFLTLDETRQCLVLQEKFDRDFDSY